MLVCMKYIVDIAKDIKVFYLMKLLGQKLMAYTDLGVLKMKAT